MVKFKKFLFYCFFSYFCLTTTSISAFDIKARTAILQDYLSGEILYETNTLSDKSALKKVLERNIEEFDILYVNTIDSGSFIADTLRNDPSRTRAEALVDIYRMLRPGEPPTKESTEVLFNNLFFSADRYDLSDVGRMKLNWRLKIEDRSYRHN